MALGTVYQDELKHRRDQHETALGTELTRLYQVPDGATLASVDCEKGDPLPDDSAALIQDVRFVYEKPSKGNPGGGGRLLRVVAVKLDVKVP